jgi:hypothetical protein
MLAELLLLLLQGIVGFGVGLASQGYTPIAEIQVRHEGQAAGGHW